MENMIFFLTFVFGPVIGVLIAWLVIRIGIQHSHEKGRSGMEHEWATLQAKLQDKEQQVQELESLYETTLSEMNALQEQLQSKPCGESVVDESPELASMLRAKAEALTQLQKEHAQLLQRALEFEQGLQEEARQNQELKNRFERAQAEVNRLRVELRVESKRRVAAEKKASRIPELESTLKTKENALTEIQQELSASRIDLQMANDLIQKTLSGDQQLQTQSSESQEKLFTGIRKRLDQFERKILQPEFSDVVQVINPKKLSQSFRELKNRDLQPVFSGFQAKFRNIIGGWFGNLKNEYTQQAQQRSDRVKKFKAGGPYSILIVDDNLKSRGQLTTILESAGYIVYKASHGEEGAILAAEHRPNLIFIDVMSDMSGLDLTKRLKVSPGLQNTPIIITAHATAEIVQNSVQLGAIDLITKPAQRLVVLEKVFQRLSQPTE